MSSKDFGYGKVRKCSVRGDKLMKKSKKHFPLDLSELFGKKVKMTYNLRLQLAAKAGIGLAAGVRYQFRGAQGLVVYMARGE